MGNNNAEDKTKFSSDVAQTVEATSDFISDNNPILVCFIVCIIVFSGIFYFELTSERQRTQDIVQAIDKMSEDSKEYQKDVSGQLRDMNNHLNNIEQGVYKHD